MRNGATAGGLASGIIFVAHRAGERLGLHQRHRTGQDLGPQASGRNVVPVEKLRCPAISEADLEAAAVGHGLMPDDADAVSHHDEP